jgi:hypothetical protein
MNTKQKLALALSALEALANPIKHFQQLSKETGMKLNGQMIIQITTNAEWYQTIAKKALDAIKS